jgi:hypothetical protein
MKRFVGGRFFAPEIAGMAGGIFVGVTHASVGIAYLVALLLLVTVLLIGFGREKHGAGHRMR